jgi:hypothetical protein
MNFHQRVTAAQDSGAKTTQAGSKSEYFIVFYFINSYTSRQMRPKKGNKSLASETGV